MKSILLEVWVYVESNDEAKEIAHDIREILNDSGLTNHVYVTDKESN